MTYIIENANVLKDTEMITTSILVKENHIASMKKAFQKYSYTKMNVDSYIMTPTYVLFDPLLQLDQSFAYRKEYFLQKFVLQGCTTILTMAEIKYETELLLKFKKMKLALMNSPIDYIIAVKIPLNLVTPSFIRICKREKIPAIFIDLKDNDDLSSMPWGWIREALFPYNCPLVPFFSQPTLQNQKKLLLEWNQILDDQKIPHIDSCLLESIPLSVQILSKIGIFPLKATIMQGGELSYNLYKRSRETHKIDAHGLYYHHQDKLQVTVHKGKVIRADKEIVFRPGFGEHIIINRPAYFSIP